MVVPGTFFPVDDTPEQPKTQRKNRQAVADKAQKGKAASYLFAINSHHSQTHEHFAESLPPPTMEDQEIHRDEQGEGEQEEKKTEDE